MFIEVTDLGTSIYDYQINIITEGDEDIVLQAIEAAIDEVKSYLTAPSKLDNPDLQVVYNVEEIFNAEGEQRNPLILRHTITIAKWYIVELCNADIIYEQARQRYDRAIDFLKKLSSGELRLGSLPTVKPNTEEQSARMGSNPKFQHHY
ncbi:MAG: phage protein Gp36 family protein [Bacteroidales bacterium]